MPRLLGYATSVVSANATFNVSAVTSLIDTWRRSSAFLTTSAVLKPLPSIRQAPSTWFAAVAPPHKKSFGNDFGNVTLYMFDFSLIHCFIFSVLFC